MVTLGYDREQKSLINLNLSINGTDIITKSSSCHIREEYTNNTLTLLLNTLVAGFLNLVLPSILTLIMNIVIICYIKHIYKSQYSETGQRRSDTSGASFRSTGSTLLVISMTYTLCYLPYCIVYILLSQFGHTHRILFYLSEISFTLRYISHSVNFYAYIFTNLRFRRDIGLLFRNVFRTCLCIKKPKKPKEKQKVQKVIYYHYRVPPSTASKKATTKVAL